MIQSNLLWPLSGLRYNISSVLLAFVPPPRLKCLWLSSRTSYIAHPIFSPKITQNQAYITQITPINNANFRDRFITPPIKYANFLVVMLLALFV